MDMFDPQHSHRNHPQGPVARGPLVVPRGQAAVLLAASDQVLHAVAQAVERPIERADPTLVTPSGDRVPQAAPPAVGAAGPAGVALVADHPTRPPARSARPGAADRALLQPPLDSLRRATLPGRRPQRPR